MHFLKYIIVIASILHFSFSPRIAEAQTGGPGCKSDDLELYGIRGEFNSPVISQLSKLNNTKLLMDMIFSADIDEDKLKDSMELTGEIKDGFPEASNLSCSSENSDLPFITQNIPLLTRAYPPVHAVGSVNGVAYPQGFNVFVFGNLSGLPSVQGPIAAKGDIDLQSFSINNSRLGNVGLIASGKVFLKSGSVAGNIYYGEDYKQQWINVSQGTLQNNANVVDFDQVQTNFVKYSELLGTIDATGSTSVSPWGEIQLNNRNNGISLFNVSAKDLASATNIRLSIPYAGVAVINVSGKDITMRNLAFSTNGTPGNKILWNFYEAKSIQLQSIGLSGTILAPLAGIGFNSGNLAGQLIADSLTSGSTSFTHEPFSKWTDLPVNLGVQVLAATNLYDQCHYTLRIKQAPLTNNGECLQEELEIGFTANNHTNKSAFELETENALVSPEDNRVYAFDIQAKQKVKPSDVFTRYSQALKLRNGVDTFVQVKTDAQVPLAGSLFYQQYYNNVEVLGRGYEVVLRDGSNVARVKGFPEINIDIRTTPTVDAQWANSVAQNKIQNWSAALVNDGLAIFSPDVNKELNAELPQLVWQFVANNGQRIGINAHTAEVAFTTSLFDELSLLPFEPEDWELYDTDTYDIETLYNGPQSVEVELVHPVYDSENLNDRYTLTEGFALNEEFRNVTFVQPDSGPTIVSVDSLDDDMPDADLTKMMSVKWVFDQCKKYFDDITTIYPGSSSLYLFINTADLETYGITEKPEKLGPFYDAETYAIFLPLQEGKDVYLKTDTICHEYAHSVARNARPIYIPEAGEAATVHEAWADIMSILMTMELTGQRDWILAEEYEANGARNYEHPELKESHVTTYNTPEWNALEKIHHKAVIIGRWAYLITDSIESQRTGVNDISCPYQVQTLDDDPLVARAILKNIVVEAYLVFLKNNDANFTSFAVATSDAATQLYPDNPRVKQAISSAWKAVGVFRGIPIELSPHAGTNDVASGSLLTELKFVTSPDHAPWSVSYYPENTPDDITEIELSSSDLFTEGTETWAHTFVNLDANQTYVWLGVTRCAGFKTPFTTGSSAVQISSPEIRHSLEAESVYILGNIGSYHPDCAPFTCSQADTDSETAEAMAITWSPIEHATAYATEVNPSPNLCDPTNDDLDGDRIRVTVSADTNTLRPGVLNRDSTNYLHIQAIGEFEGQVIKGECKTFPFINVDNFRLLSTTATEGDVEFNWDPVQNANTYTLVVYHVQPNGQRGEEAIAMVLPGDTHAYTPDMQELMGAGQYVWYVEVELDDGTSFMSASQDMTVIDEFLWEDEVIVRDPDADTWTFSWVSKGKDPVTISLTATNLIDSSETISILDHVSMDVTHAFDKHSIELNTEQLKSGFNGHLSDYSFTLFVHRHFDLPHKPGEYVETNDEIEFFIEPDKVSLDLSSMEEYRGAVGIVREAEYFVSPTFTLEWTAHWSNHYNIILEKAEPEEGDTQVIYETIAHSGSPDDTQRLLSANGEAREITLPDRKALYRLTILSLITDDPSFYATSQSYLIRLKPELTFITPSASGKEIPLDFDLEWKSGDVDYYRVRARPGNVFNELEVDSGVIAHQGDDDELQSYAMSLENTGNAVPYTFQIDLLGSDDPTDVLVSRFSGNHHTPGYSVNFVGPNSSDDEPNIVDSSLDLEWEGQADVHTYYLRVSEYHLLDKDTKEATLGELLFSKTLPAGTTEYTFNDLPLGGAFLVSISALPSDSTERWRFYPKDEVLIYTRPGKVKFHGYEPEQGDDHYQSYVQNTEDSQYYLAVKYSAEAASYFHIKLNDWEPDTGSYIALQGEDGSTQTTYQRFPFGHEYISYQVTPYSRWNVKGEPGISESGQPCPDVINYVAIETSDSRIRVPIDEVGNTPELDGNLIVPGQVTRFLVNSPRGAKSIIATIEGPDAYVFQTTNFVIEASSTPDGLVSFDLPIPDYFGQMDGDQNYTKKIIVRFYPSPEPNKVVASCTRSQTVTITFPKNGGSEEPEEQACETPSVPTLTVLKNSNGLTAPESVSCDSFGLDDDIEQVFQLSGIGSSQWIFGSYPDGLTYSELGPGHVLFRENWPGTFCGAVNADMAAITGIQIGTMVCPYVVKCRAERTCNGVVKSSEASGAQWVFLPEN